MTPKTVTIGVALVLVGVLVGLNVPMAEAQRDGSYAISAATTPGAVWRINVSSGQVSMCRSETWSSAIGPDTKPAGCAPWGPER